MNFQMNPQSLGALNSVPIDMTLQALDWQQRAQQADQMSLAELAAQQQRAAQKHALDQEQGRIANETSLAQLPGIRAQSDSRVRTNKLEEATFDQTMQQKLREFAIKATDDELKAYDQSVQKLLNSNNPEERKRGEKMWQASPIMMKAREDHKLKMELEDRRANNDIRIKQTVPGTASEPPANPTDIAAGLIDALQKGRMDYVKGATAFFSLSELLPDTDPRKTQYRKIAENLEKARLADRTAGAKPQVDVEGMGVPTVTPQANPALGGTANPATADRPARQANSERVTIYKDGKAVGTVPKAQADQAVQEGYTLK